MKTAEEILAQCCTGPEASAVWSHEEALNAMREFAAQEVAKEVEAYKERLIAEVRADVRNLGPTMLRGDIALLIDATK